MEKQQLDLKRVVCIVVEWLIEYIFDHHFRGSRTSSKPPRATSHFPRAIEHIEHPLSTIDYYYYVLLHYRYCLQHPGSPLTE